tara:strand:- start:905 stop:1111 length:207 start_codon:yes stop_codon:yes gene_type:complete
MIIKRYDLLGNLLVSGESNDNNEPHGYWVRYAADGKLKYKGRYNNGNPEGYWEQLMINSKFTIKEFYI